MHALPTVETKHGTFISRTHFKGLFENLEQAIKAKDSSLFSVERGLRVKGIVGIEEFVCSADYMNQAAAVRPKIMQHLINLFESGQYYVEALGTGGIGIGKGYWAQLGTAYCLYLNACLHNPQVEHGLWPGASMYFVIQSKTESLARRAVFNEFTEMIKLSPWFMKNFKPDFQVKTELRFPNNIYVTPFGGTDTAVMGLNVMGAIADELNFMDRIEDSAKSRHTGEDEYDQAERIYHRLSRRMKSRFHTHGVLPGKFFLLSSSNYPGDFTDRKIDEAKTDPTIYVMNMSQWEALPEDRISDETFRVELGNDYMQSRVLKDGEEPRPDAEILEVPVDYYDDFIKDVDGSLRDLAGKSTSSRRPFIPYKEQIVQIVKDTNAITGGKSLFCREEMVLEPLADPLEEIDWSKYVDLDYLKSGIMLPEAVRAVHLDVGISDDAAGLSVGHIAGYHLPKEHQILDPLTGGFKEVTEMDFPIFHLDGAVRLIGGYTGELELTIAYKLVVFLKSKLNIRWATADSYQSAMILQAWRAAKMRVGTLSVDTDILPYVIYKNAIKDMRVRFSSGLLAKETRELIKNGDMVDHEEGGKKDIADSAAGVCYMLQTRESKRNRRRSSREARSASSRRVQQRMNRPRRRIKV